MNDFGVTTDEVDGHSLEDYLQGAERTEDTRFAVVNVTLKNTGDEPFVPSEKMSAQLIGELTYQESWDEIFTERDNELSPGKEITGNLVYISDNLYEDGVVYMSYETGAREEVKFELPVPNE
ncbi:hypothetical protein GCM10007063_35070 [Lentibacillus kapialis]|uniref:DUF4352 domain-containing protein n=1 Tax=Lentibacillus kapialis TaxID=340214 RepID=A0A917V1P3_9BACI|nr:DUF4352 domain-containing protein [Lentibacillus kapialis]GGK09580.1 hypothetical protein GCM10007063_35070 [Lentibacillus kapialis]